MVRESSQRQRRWFAQAARWAAGTLVVTGLLAGCGGSASSTVVDLRLKSAGVEANGSTKPNVFCGWGMTWLPLEWEPPPDGTKDLAVYFGIYKYVHEHGTRKLAIPYAVLLHNINPSTRRLPVNAFLERARWSNFGPQSCPVAKQGKHVVVEVFALDRHQFEWEMRKRLALRLTEEALADPHQNTTPQSTGKLMRDVIGIGRLITTYPGPHDQL